MNLILIGFKSCGKSTVGLAVAERLGLTFVDTDTLVERKHATLTGESLPFRELFRLRGRAYFTELEQQILAEIAHLDHHVIATGGGTVIHGPIPAATRQQSTVVYLAAQPNVLWPRIKQGGIPTFFKTAHPQHEFYELFKQRAPIYQALADYIVDVSHQDVAQSVEKIIRHYRK